MEKQHQMDKKMVLMYVNLLMVHRLLLYYNECFQFFGLFEWDCFKDSLNGSIDAHVIGEEKKITGWSPENLPQSSLEKFSTMTPWAIVKITSCNVGMQTLCRRLKLISVSALIQKFMTAIAIEMFSMCPC